MATIKRDDGLTPRQEKAIIALCSQPTVPKAAESLNIPVRTLYHWLQERAFAAAYRKARREAFGQAIGLLQHYAALAVNKLAHIIADPNAPAQAKVTAAVAVLKMAREGIELDDVVARLETLEQAAKAQQNGKG